MSKLLLSVATVVMMAAPAFAEGISCNSPAQDQWMSEADLTAKLVAQGYDVKGIKIESGCYEIKALDASGARVEIAVDPVTGELAGTENGASN